MNPAAFEQLAGNLSWGALGLIPAIVQNVETRDVLMLAWMDREALHLTLISGEAYFWSRSRQKIWHKGATSGSRQVVRDVRIDCDGDAVLLLVEPLGPACHTGAPTCFFRGWTALGEMADAG